MLGRLSAEVTESENRLACSIYGEKTVSFISWKERFDAPGLFALSMLPTSMRNPPGREDKPSPCISPAQRSVLGGRSKAEARAEIKVVVVRGGDGKAKIPH